MLNSLQLKKISNEFLELERDIERDVRHSDRGLCKTSVSGVVSKIKAYSELFDKFSRDMLVFETKKQILLEKYPDMIILFKED